jgi:hypothetical protein
VNIIIELVFGSLPDCCVKMQTDTRISHIHLKLYPLDTFDPFNNSGPGTHFSLYISIHTGTLTSWLYIGKVSVNRFQNAWRKGVKSSDISVLVLNHAVAINPNVAVHNHKETWPATTISLRESSISVLKHGQAK